MNINCIICSDLFIPTAEIYSTTCGHMFHYACLIQWLDRSKTCPQCRNKCTERSIHRIYLNLQTSETISDDAVTLQHKVDNLTYQIKLKDKDIQNYTDKYKTVREQNVGLRGEVKQLTDKARTSDSAIHALKDQVGYFKQKCKEVDRVNEQCQRLQDRLKNMESLNVAINGTKDQVNDMLRHNKDPEALSLLVASLKKELIETDRKKRQYSNKLMHIQSDVHASRRELTQVKNSNELLKLEIEEHRNCENERRYLKSKIAELQTKLEANSSTYTPNKSVMRIISESPAPRPCNLNDAVHDIDPDKLESPTIMEKVKEIQESDSPYLPLKSGMSSLLNAKFTIASGNSTAKPSSASNNYSFIKGSMQKIETVSKPDYCYNGLGGHSKQEVFPTSIKPLGFSMKRSKSSGMPSSKFRKLASNKKLDQFVQKNLD